MQPDASAFLEWLEQHDSGRSPCRLDELISDSGGPAKVAVVVVDLVNGFCKEGPLASPAVGSLVEPIANFLKLAHSREISKFLFPCDSHAPDSPEFGAFPPHCVAGTAESELVSEFRELPFANLFRRYDKGSVSSLVGTALPQELEDGDVRTIICAGDCTDLCLYHLAVGLRFYANHHGCDWRIVVPQDLVATYDLPLEVAIEIDTLPHPGPFLHQMFLYHLELNGVDVVGALV